MPLHMLISPEWLQNKILADPDADIGAGVALDDLEQVGMFIHPEPGDEAQNEKIVELKIAFGTFVRQLRRRDQMSVAELSRKADVDEEELRHIEHDAAYKPRPRTVHQLATIFHLPTPKFMKLAGAAATNDAQFCAEAVKFAARSDDLSQLTAEERTLLNEFVAFLSKQDGQ